MFLPANDNSRKGPFTPKESQSEHENDVKFFCFIKFWYFNLNNTILATSVPRSFLLQCE